MFSPHLFNKNTRIIYFVFLLLFGKCGHHPRNWNLSKFFTLWFRRPFKICSSIFLSVTVGMLPRVVGRTFISAWSQALTCTQLFWWEVYGTLFDFSAPLYLQIVKSEIAATALGFAKLCETNRTIYGPFYAPLIRDILGNVARTCTCVWLRC